MKLKEIIAIYSHDHTNLIHVYTVGKTVLKIVEWDNAYSNHRLLIG
jgi:hypothetical protein